MPNGDGPDFDRLTSSRVRRIDVSCCFTRGNGSRRDARVLRVEGQDLSNQFFSPDPFAPIAEKRSHLQLHFKLCLHCFRSLGACRDWRYRADNSISTSMAAPSRSADAVTRSPGSNCFRASENAPRSAIGSPSIAVITSPP